MRKGFWFRILVLAASTPLWGDNSEWPQREASHVEMPTPVAAGDMLVGEVFTLLDPQTGLPSALDAQEFARLWDKQGWPAEALSLPGGQGGFVDMRVIGQHTTGAQIRWNPETASLVVAVPEEWMSKSESVSDGRTRYSRPQQQWVDPAQVSGYLNVRARQDFEDSGSEQGTVRLEGLFNFRGLALQSDLSHRYGDAGSETHFDEYSLSREFGEWTLRGGDWRVPSRGLQVSPTVTGLHIGKGVSRWSQLVRGRADTFTVDTPSTLEIWQDAQQVRTLELDPGTYTYREFGLVGGDTTTEARLRDEAGQFVRLQAPSGYSDILESGEWSGLLSFGVGRGRDEDSIWGQFGQPLFDNSREPASDNLLVHGFVERGMGGGWEAAMDWQGDSHGLRGGLGASFDSGSEEGASRLHLRGNLAGTRHYDFDGEGWGAYLSGAWSHPDWGSLSGSLSWRGDNFDSPGSLRQWGASASYSLTRGEWTHALTASYSETGGSGSENYRYRVTRRIGQDWRLGASVDISDEETSGFLTVSWLPRTARPDRRYSVQGSMSSEGDAQGTFTHDRVDGEWSYGASVSGQYADDLGTGEIYGYAANQRFSTTANLSYAQTRREDRQQASLSFASALAFADGRWSVSRPIDDSFVLIKTHPTWKEQGMRTKVNPDPWGGYDARTGTLPAVWPLQSHPDGNTLRVMAEGDTMLSLDDGDFRARLGPHRGAVLVVGNDAATLIRGTLLLPDGKALAKTRIRLVHEESGEVVSTFTSASGRFSAGPMRSGAWRVELRGPFEGGFDTEAFATGPNGLVNLKQVRLRSEQDQKDSEQAHLNPQSQSRAKEGSMVASGPEQAQRPQTSPPVQAPKPETTGGDQSSIMVVDFSNRRSRNQSADQKTETRSPAPAEDTGRSTFAIDLLGGA